MDWRPIDSAPQDGTVILTNDGTGRWSNGWKLCDGDGNIPSCCEEGESISEISPTLWKKFK